MGIKMKEILLKIGQSRFFSEQFTFSKNPFQPRQRTEEKKRKQEEKESKRFRDQGGNDSEYELQMARERDAQSTMNRERRKSFNAGGTGPIPGSHSFPPTTGNTGYPIHPNGATGYPYSAYSNIATAGTPVPTGPYGSGNIGRSRKQSGAFADITRQLNDLDIDGNKEYAIEHDRKVSSGSHTRKYSTNDPTYGAERPRTVSGNYVDRSNPYPTAAYTPASGPYSNPKNVPAGPGIANPYPNYYASSPNMRPSDISHGSTNQGYQGSMYPSRDQAELIARSATPFGAQVYPRGHVLEGQPVVNNNSRSRAPSPNPGTNHNFVCASILTLLTVSMSQGHTSINMSGNSPRTESHQLPAPEAFSRAINAANSYAPFDNIKVIDMDDLHEAKIPKMPIVLTTHDIYPDDWKRYIQVRNSPTFLLSFCLTDCDFCLS